MDLPNKYLSAAFEPMTLAQAKDVVLSPDTNNPSKFEEETNQFVIDLATHRLINKNDKVLDFGCGMGRLSKAIIDIIGCEVVGVDFSRHMLSHATKYVEHFDKFDTTTEYHQNDIDVAIASLVLQHVEKPQKEINAIFSALKPGGKFILVNEQNRLVPIRADANNAVIWHDDGINIRELVAHQFVQWFSVQHNTICNKYELLSVWQKPV